MNLSKLTKLFNKQSKEIKEYRRFIREVHEALVDRGENLSIWEGAVKLDAGKLLSNEKGSEFLTIKDKDHAKINK